MSQQYNQEEQQENEPEYNKLSREIEDIKKMVKKETRALKELLSSINAEEAGACLKGPENTVDFDDGIDEKLNVEWGRFNNHQKG